MPRRETIEKTFYIVECIIDGCGKNGIAKSIFPLDKEPKKNDIIYMVLETLYDHKCTSYIKDIKIIITSLKTQIQVIKQV